MKIGEATGVVEEGATQEYTDRINAEKRLYDSTPVGRSGTAKVAEIGTGILTSIAVPGGAGARGGRFIAGSALSGGVIGGTSSTEDASLSSNARHAVTGAVLGASGAYVVGKVGERVRKGLVPLFDRHRGSVAYSQATSANLAKLTKDLEQRTLKSIFNKDGTLTKNAIEDAYRLQKVAKYDHKSVIRIELSKRGNIEDWIKARTQKFHTGLESLDVSKSKLSQTADVHFYKNVKTGEVLRARLQN